MTHLLRQTIKSQTGKIGASRTAARGEAARAEARGSDVKTRDHAQGLEPILLSQSLWDDWTQDKLGECLDAVEVEVRRLGLGARPVRERLDAVADQAGEVVLQSVRDRLRAALARPGTLLQRALRRVTGFLMAALPLVALLWVAYNVVIGYYRASTGARDYLGVNFAVSSALLIVVAWAVPFVCDRLLRPSLERAALRGMRQGLAEGLDRLDGQMRAAIAETARHAHAARQEANTLFNEISALVLKPVEATRASLSRLLVTPSRRPAPAAR